MRTELKGDHWFKRNLLWWIAPIAIGLGFLGFLITVIVTNNHSIFMVAVLFPLGVGFITSVMSAIFAIRARILSHQFGKKSHDNFQKILQELEELKKNH